VAKYKRIVEQDFLAKYHLSFDQVIAQSDYNMEPLAYAYARPGEMGLGNMITDSFRYAVQKAEGKNYEYVNLALEPLGLIRDSFLKGKITVADVFQVLSLGLGTDGVAGYPLVAFYINGKELKDVLEVEASASLIKEDAYLQVSGVKFVYNPHRIPLDRVTSVLVQEADGEYRPLNSQKLYRICANRYAAEMINYVVHVTHGLLNVQPKDKNGKVLKDLKEAIVHLDGKTPKSGELKEWLALNQFLSSFKDTNLPQKYNGPEGRYHAEPSWKIKDLVAGGNAITYGALILGFILICLIGFVVRYVVRRIKILRQSPTKP
jgi:2',3'-cyclic-nucleotide 2'-phosphodiesterase (5'-nucleotidase family)